MRRPSSRNFTKGFLVVTPGITIRDRLRVLKPNDPDSYYESRELVPRDMLQDLEQARIVITNYHAFKLRETLGVFTKTALTTQFPSTYVIGQREAGNHGSRDTTAGRTLRTVLGVREADRERGAGPLLLHRLRADL